MSINELQSQMWHDMLVRETQLSQFILSARIVLMDMEIEVEAYRRSSGENESYRIAKERFDTLWTLVQNASSIDDEAYMQRLISEKLQRENSLLRKKISDLEHQINAVATAWNAKL